MEWNGMTKKLLCIALCIAWAIVKGGMASPCHDGNSHSSAEDSCFIRNQMDLKGEGETLDVR